ncbi:MULTISPECIES: ABC transporter permease [Acidobacteriaceae]|uniref:ABC transporter permease n=1 Tax=Acidobacteriaceae TaxID=204434 RepID=UPI00131C0EF7|nr:MULTISPECIES: ABC transporter permease [Acidobacteriaceae]MDW5266328.1 ABC transporter permease [Edaphobacter sp.]
MGSLLRRLHYLLNRRQLDHELENDMEFHREMMAREGRRNFGNMLRLREQARDAWGWTWIERLGQDLRYAARTLMRSPGFTATAVLVLAIGIGVNVTAFSLFNMIALKPLPVRDPDSLVQLQRRSPEIIQGEMPYPSVIFYRDHAKTLSAVMAVMGVPPMNLEGSAEPVRTSFATGNYFSELGTPAALGRLFEPVVEDKVDAAPVAVLSYGAWQRRFGGDPSVVGRTIRLDNKPATVIGILPSAFASLGGQTPDVWLPLAQQPYFIEGSKVLTDSSASSVRMWARLAPGVTAKMAEQELLALTNELRRQHPKEIWDNEYIRSDPGGHLQVMRPEMYQVAAMVAVLTLLILMVACANLGGLLLARGVTREHEMGIRMAIGASRKRIFRQLFTESLLLASLGAIVGVALSYAVLRVALVWLDAPPWLSPVPDWRVLAFSISVALGAAIFFGLTPALQIARQRQRKTIARQVLIGAQVAASCVLLIVAGLLVRAMHHTLYTSPGFGYEHVFSIDPQLGAHGYTPSSAQMYLNQMESRLLAMPGVTSVSLVRLPPMGRSVSRIDTEIEGHSWAIYPNWVEPGFFQTMNIPLLIGRTLLPGEKNAVVISESFARRRWPDQNPLGKQFETDKSASGQHDTVVGVVGDAHLNALNDDDAVEEYWSAQADDMPAMSLVVKMAGPTESFIPVAKTIAEGLDPKVFPEIRPLKSMFNETVSKVEQIAMIVSLIGLVAVLLAGIGIVGLVAYSVSQRTKEIAIRLALGAERAHVLAAVLRQFAWPMMIGLFAGVGVAAGASKVLRKVLFGISNLDPASYVGAIAVLVGIVGLATLLPARRALQLNMAKILHYE